MPVSAKLARRLLIRGRSMEPTVSDGQRVWASPAPYWFTGPARGDLVAVWAPPEATQLVLKRIAGLPGERVGWIGGALTINGERLDEPYARIPASAPGDAPTERRLGRLEYFVAGDARLASRDSRHYGPVPRRLIYGKVLGIRNHMAPHACCDLMEPAVHAPRAA